MYHKPKVPDRQILQKVTVQLPARGIRPPCNVRVSVHNGTVTLAGKIEFEMQRKAAIHAASGVNGVERVVDQLTVMRNTIGGWHAKPLGTRTKYAPAERQPPPPSEAAKQQLPPPAQPQAEQSPSPQAKSGS